MSEKQQKVSKDDKLIESIFVYIVVVIIGFALFNKQLIGAYTWIVEKEITMIHGLTRDMGMYSEKMHSILEVITKTKTAPWTIDKVMVVSKHADEYTKWLYLMLIIPLVIAMTIKKRSIRYNRRFTGNTLIAEMAKSYPRIRPIVHLDFGQGDEERGAFTWAETPLEWCENKGIIRTDGTIAENKKTFDPYLCKQEIIKSIETDLYRGASPKHMDVTRRFLFAVYSLWYLNRHKEHNQLLDQGAMWFKVKKNKKTGDYKYQWNVPEEWLAKINKTCEEGMVNPKVKKVLDRYIFQDTVLKGMMEPIQKTAAADYIWLKAINPNLYYTMHQTGNQTSYQIVKGIAYVFEHEKKLYMKGKRLVSVEAQAALTKEDVLNKIDFNQAVADTWYRLEKTGFMKPTELINYTDEQLKHMEDAQEDSKEIDINKPLHLFYHIKGGGENKTPRTINTLYFYDPETGKIVKEISTPRGHLEANDKPILEWYLYNHYIMVIDINTLSKWLKGRGIMEEIYYYDLLWDANEVYSNEAHGAMKTMYHVEKATGLTYNDIIAMEKETGQKNFMTIQERHIEVHNRVLSGLKNLYLDVSLQ